MSALTGDDRFEKTVNEIPEDEKKEGLIMCEVLDKIEARVEARGEARGIKIGED